MKRNRYDSIDGLKALEFTICLKQRYYPIHTYFRFGINRFCSFFGCG